VTHDVRTLEPDELRAAHALFGASIHRGPADDERWSRSAAAYSPGRTLGVHDDGLLVGTARSFPSRLAVPGGAVLPMAAVTAVGVRADHTRRGLLTAMMRAQLTDVAERGEVFATLHASEARIYGRFGYGVATRGRDVRVRAEGAAWRPDVPGGGRVRLLDRAEIVPVLRDVHESLALRRAGGMTRFEGWWQVAVGRRVEDREHVVAAVHTGAGGDDGFALAFPSGTVDDFARQTLQLEDLHAADVTATAALWRFLLDIDLVGSVTASLRPLDEPLELLLADPRDCAVTGQGDETWLRIVDVPAALAARSWGEALPVVLAVRDPLLEDNAGVYQIGDGLVERLGPLGGSARPELECDVAGLAMAYLGDRTPSQLAATGWWRVHDREALPCADAAFATGEAPWCGTFF
jgi:predicted acetyltransferase